MKKFLHVGCGQKYKSQTTRGFNSDEWEEIRLDINENVNPDIIGTITDMSEVGDGSVDAVFSSHNIEHLYFHEVPLALKEFLRVLKDDGFAVITCPDLKQVCKVVAEDKLTEKLYTSPAGDIAPIDILYGHRGSLKNGNLYMAHKCGFTEKVLRAMVAQSGFVSIATKTRGHPFYDIWLLATKTKVDINTIKTLVRNHFP